MVRKRAVRQPITRGHARVPVIMQMEALECGAAALAMVLAYFGKWVPMDQVRHDCGISRDGSNARNIIRAARNYGLDAGAYKLEPDQLKLAGKFPCIIHWNFNHFVVLDGFAANKAYINDPARGTLAISYREFDQAFTGICILLAPTASFEPGGKPPSVIDFARRRLAGSFSSLVFVVLTTVIATFITMINPVFSRIFIDRLLPGKNPEWLYPFTLAMAAFALVQMAVGWIDAVTMLKVEGKFAIYANSSFMWHILRMPMDFFAQRRSGDIANRQGTNEGIASSFMHTLTPLAINTGMMVFYLAVMIRYSLLLTAIGIASIVLNLVTAQVISGLRVNILRVQMRDANNLYSTTVSGIVMIETIKSAGAENGFFEKWAGYQASVNTQAVKYERINQFLGALPGVFSAIADMAIMMTGVFLTMKGEFTVGMIMAFTGYMASFAAPASSLIAAGQTLQEMRAQMEQVEDIMNYPVDVTGAGPRIEAGQVYTKLSGVLEMRDVTFGYSRLAPPLIEHFNLTMKTGSRVALTGPSGCGKSTITKLISGLYQPWSGEILFDGQPISAVSREIFTSSLAVVDQDIILFEDSIANNIKMWDHSIADFEMIMAARDARLHDVILEREDNYQYKILEGGKDFSGGQRQRLEIARVLAQDPTIIIMDEATSALDARTEAEVVTDIRDRGVTCIVIAHRLSTIRDCDEIIVLDQGKVVERGSHDELIARDGMYTRLVSSE